MDDRDNKAYKFIDIRSSMVESMWGRLTGRAMPVVGTLLRELSNPLEAMLDDFLMAVVSNHART